jgi:hypothetical protein
MVLRWYVPQLSARATGCSYSLRILFSMVGRALSLSAAAASKSGGSGVRRTGSSRAVACFSRGRCTSSSIFQSSVLIG